MTKEEIGAKLKAARLSCGMTQQEVADKIGRKQPIIGHWETGYSQPDANTLFTLCDLYETTVDEVFGFKKDNISLSKKDKDFLERYNNLDPYGQETVSYILDRESKRVESLQKQANRIQELENESSPSAHIYPYLGKIACAGTGFYFDDIPAETIEAPYVDGADFIIGVSGESMEPDYHDGEKLYVKKVEYLRTGDVGIFTIGNECFLKELGEYGLISRSKDYSDIPGDEKVRLVGKVIGKVEV